MTTEPLASLQQQQGQPQPASQWRNIHKLQFCLIKSTLSFLEETCRYPLVLIKTHQQVSPEAKARFRTNASNSSSNNNSNTKKQAAASSFTSKWSTVHPPPHPPSLIQHPIPSAHQTARYTYHLYRTHGARGLFRGYPWYVGPAVPVNVLYFYSYNEAKDEIHEYVARRNLHHHPPRSEEKHKNSGVQVTSVKDSVKDAVNDNTPDKASGVEEVEKAKTQKRWFVSKVLIPSLAGIIADAVCLTCWVPFDVISQHLQLQDVRPFPPPPSHASPPSPSSSHFTHPPSHSSSSSSSFPSSYRTSVSSKPLPPLPGLRVVQYIGGQGGLRGYYRGFFISLMLHSPSSGVWWSAYECMRYLLSGMGPIVAAPASRSTSSLGIDCPISPHDRHPHEHENVNSRPSLEALSPQQSLSPTTIPVLTASTLRPSHSLPSPLFPSSLRSTISLSIPEHVPGILMSGAVAGVAASLVSNPLDVIKTRLQTSFPSTPPTTSFGRSQNAQQQNHNNQVLHQFSALLRSEGISGFFRGYIPRVCISIPTSALSLLVYEVALKASSPHDH